MNSPLASCLRQNVMFTGGPHVIWGLTAYILDRFLKDILLRYKIDDFEPPKGPAAP